METPQHDDMANIIDMTTLASLRNMMEASAFNKLTSIYLTSSQDLIQQIQAAEQPNELEKIRIAVHTLKSSSRTLGANKLAALCHETEALCQPEVNNATDQLKKLLLNIQLEFEKVVTVLTQLPSED